MRLKLSQIKPNPFKKQINNGSLDKDTITKLKSNIKELGLMGSIPVFKKNKTYYQISHHHRAEALKQEFGKDHKVEVVVHNYSDEKALKGMVVENMTQRADDFKDNVQNLAAIRTFLKKKTTRPDSGHVARKQGGGSQPEIGSTSHIAEWLNQNGEVMSLSSIKDHLSVSDNLSNDLYKNVEKTHSGEGNRRTNGKTISKSQAIMLASFKDKKEQKDLAKNILTSRNDKVRDQSNLLSKYKALKEDEITMVKDAAQKETYEEEGWNVVDGKNDTIKVKRKKTIAEKKQHKAVVDAIRKGKKDIADVDVAVVMPDIGRGAIEVKLDFLDSMFKVRFKEMETFLEKTSYSELENIYMQISMWAQDDLAGFMKKLIAELAKKGKNKNKVVFKVINNNLKGSI